MEENLKLLLQNDELHAEAASTKHIMKAKCQSETRPSRSEKQTSKRAGHEVFSANSLRPPELMKMRTQCSRRLCIWSVRECSEVMWYSFISEATNTKPFKHLGWKAHASFSDFWRKYRYTGTIPKHLQKAWYSFPTAFECLKTGEQKGRGNTFGLCSMLSDLQILQKN